MKEEGFSRVNLSFVICQSVACTLGALWSMRFIAALPRRDSFK